VKLLALSVLFLTGCAAHKPVGYHISVPASCLTQNIEMEHCTSPIKCAKLHVAYKPECSTVSPEK
jgi:hypothetical protein